MLAILLSAAAAFAAELSSPKPPVPLNAQGGDEMSQPAVMKTARAELRWVPGAPDVTVHDKRGRVDHRIPLARPDRRHKAAVGLRALLPARGDHFLVVEETRKDVGLHLAERRGAEKPKATVVRAVLRLVHEQGRVIWEHQTSDKTLVGERADPQHLRISPNGTVAILLQDVDTFSSNRPVLSVIDNRGREALSLDYTAWARIDEFALSDDGRYLALHGFGMLPQEGTMGRGVGLYDTKKGELLWAQPLPREDDGRRSLQVVDADGWTCCVHGEGGLLAFGHTGGSKRMTPEEMWRQFGVRP